MTSHPAPLLTVDLAALAANYATLARKTANECGAVVKANAYGLGVEGVAPALAKAGCKSFFVATLEEGVQLRTLLPEVDIYVFHGPYASEEQDFIAHGIIPVINSPAQLERWRGLGQAFALHVDTGMTRLGLTATEFAGAFGAGRLAHCSLIMSHLSCANETAHPQNAQQLTRFTAVRTQLPNARASLANSSGLFLAQDYHFDLARPGCSLYGINPGEGANPMAHVATLSAPIIQLRECDRDEVVGYGATAQVKKGARIATVQLGYADGFLRSLSNRIAGYIGAQHCPLLGRVSMDMVMLDISSVPENILAKAQFAEFINQEQPVDVVAEAAQTIGYEVFTRLGRRVKRHYVG